MRRKTGPHFRPIRNGRRLKMNPKRTARSSITSTITSWIQRLFLHLSDDHSRIHPQQTRNNSTEPMMLAADNLRYKKIPLNNGSAIPALGFGTLIPDPVATKVATKTALEA